MTRDIIFLSHGRPEDDELTRWLAGRLTARGYKVWADLEQLHGGDPFWADIERTIRTEAARFLILVTRRSVTRKGVLDELAEATDVARRLKDDRFIIPIKGDDLPWSEFPIQLKRLNGLDFSLDWLKGLSELRPISLRDCRRRGRGGPLLKSLRQGVVDERLCRPALCEGL